MAQLPWADLMRNAKDAPAPTYDLLPAGEYLITVTKSEVGNTRAGEVMFKLRGTVVGGPHNNRMVFPNIIVPGPTADQARSGYFINDLKAYGLSDAFLETQPDTDAIANALLHKQVIVTLEVAPRRDNPNEKTNNVKRAKLFTGQAPASPQAAPGGTPAPAPQQAQPTPQPQPQPVQFQPQPQPQAQPAPQQQPIQQQPTYQQPPAQQPQPQQQPVQQPQYQPQQQQPQQPVYENAAPQQAPQQPAAAAPAEQPQYQQPAPQQAQPQAAPQLPQSPFAAVQPQ